MSRLVGYRCALCTRMYREIDVLEADERPRAIGCDRHGVSPLPRMDAVELHPGATIATGATLAQPRPLAGPGVDNF